MLIKIIRTYKGEDYTIGKLFIDGEYFCDTLEDAVRDIKTIDDKIPGKTAIPVGCYKVRMDIQSPKYSKRDSYKWCNGYLPRIMNVPFFDGILIHCGNTKEDTDGCILVGENNEKGKVNNSRVIFRKLYDILMTDPDNIMIDII